MLTFINDLVILIIGRHIESKSPYSSINYFIDEATKLQKWLDDVYKTIVPILTILSDFRLKALKFRFVSSYKNQFEKGAICMRMRVATLNIQ